MSLPGMALLGVVLTLAFPRRQLYGTDVFRAGSLGTTSLGIRYSLSNLQRIEGHAFYARLVEEQIFARLRQNEAKPLVRDQTLNRAFSHVLLLVIVSLADRSLLLLQAVNFSEALDTLVGDDRPLELPHVDADELRMRKTSPKLF